MYKYINNIVLLFFYFLSFYDILDIVGDEIYNYLIFTFNNGNLHFL